MATEERDWVAELRNELAKLELYKADHPGNTANDIGYTRRVVLPACKLLLQQEERLKEVEAKLNAVQQRSTATRATEPDLTQPGQPA